MSGLTDKIFTPSEYQQKIFDFVSKGNGNGVIKACAGAGKTYTLIQSMKLLPKHLKCLFIAFNKSIVDELEKKLIDYPNCTAKTIHSLGFLMMKRNFQCNIKVDEYKYRKYVKRNIHNLTDTDRLNGYTKRQLNQYMENILKLIDFSRFNIAQSRKEIQNVSDLYGIPVTADEIEVAEKCLKWGSYSHDIVDYTDMVWIPYELGLSPKGLQYDWIMFDECQDASLMSLQLFDKCFKRGTRFLAVGDSDQTINLFAGSSVNAFNILSHKPHTQNFSLPITYRCAKSIVRYANSVVPEIKAREDAPEGEVKRNVHVRDIVYGDMVLSRNKAPLVILYTHLLRRNIKCYIKGNEIGEELINMMDGIDIEELNRNLMKDGVFVRLYENMFNERNRLMSTSGIDEDAATLSEYIMSIYDSIFTLSILSEDCKTKEELIKRIKIIFKDDSDGICLSTIHKAKGLESDNVYIIGHSAMLNKKCKQQWEYVQERNLKYVAYTRAKNILGFVSEEEIKPCGPSKKDETILKDIKLIENRISNALDDNLIDYDKFSQSLKKITITKPVENKEDVPFGTKDSNNSVSFLEDFFSKRKKK